MKTCHVKMLAVIAFALMTGSVNADQKRLVRTFRPLTPQEVQKLEASLQESVVPKGVSKTSSSRITKNKTRLLSLLDNGTIKRMISEKEFAALIHVESNGRNGVIGDKHLGKSSEWAWGVLQIRQCYVDDVNTTFGTNIYASDCQWDVELSKLVVQAWMTRFGQKNWKFERFARMHNGGPQGWNPKYTETYAKTNRYWAKVRPALLTVSK